MGSIDYVYKPHHGAIYNAFAPIGWCAIFAWIIFLSHTKNTNGIYFYYNIIIEIKINLFIKINNLIIKIMILQRGSADFSHGEDL